MVMYPFVIFSLVKKNHISQSNYQKTRNHISLYYWYLSFWGLLLFNRPPVCEVCPNHEVTKHWTGTSPDLGSVAYSYVAIIYAPPRLPYLAANCLSKGETHSCPSSHAISFLPVCTWTGSSDHPGFPCLHPIIMKILRLPRRLLHKVLRLPELLLSPTFFSITPSPLASQCRNLLLHTPDITNTAVFLSPRLNHRQKCFYISPCLYRDHSASPLRCTPYPFHAPRILAATPPTLLPWSADDWYTTPKSASLFPWEYLTPPTFSTSHTTAASLSSPWPSRFDNFNFGGDKDTVELQILIRLVWLGGNWTKRVINRMIWIIFPFWPGGVLTIWKMQQ